MVICSSFASNIDCALTITNETHIKFIVLSILLIYSVIVLFISRFIDKEKSYLHYWGFYLSKVLTIIYIVFAPIFYLFLLNTNINLEIFTLIIIGFYLVATALFIGIAVYYGGSSIFQLFGFDDWNEFKDKYREKQSLRKYG